MTAITIWRNDEIEGHPVLWAVADSLVSDNEQNQIIGDAVKIFSLPIICKRPGTDGFFSDPYFVHTLGYCFAGSTLMGQNTYLGLAPLLSNIISAHSYIPSMTDIAQQILAYLKPTFDDYKVIAGPNAMFEVAVFGHCRRNQSPEIFHFRPALVNGIYEMNVTAHQDLATNDFVYLGDESIAIKQQIVDAFAGDSLPGRPVSRAPCYVIEDRIASAQSPSIGGDIQLAIADRSGFRPMTVVKPYVQGQPAAYFSYLGRELTPDLTTVGEAQMAPMDMA